MLTTKTEKKPKTRRKFILLILAILAAIGGYIAWDRGFREYPQEAWVTATPEMRFKYGSIGAEFDAHSINKIQHHSTW